MSDFSAFMVQNVIEEVGFVASSKFVDGEQNPIEWKLRPVSADLDERLRKDCTRKSSGKRGSTTNELDTDKYLGKLCVATITYPDLNNQDLQEFYHVMSGEDLLKQMLNSGEYTELKAKVMEVNGYDLSFDEMVDEAKN